MCICSYMMNIKLSKTQVVYLILLPLYNVSPQVRRRSYDLLIHVNTFFSTYYYVIFFINSFICIHMIHMNGHFNSVKYRQSIKERHSTSLFYQNQLRWSYAWNFFFHTANIPSYIKTWRILRANFLYSQERILLEEKHLQCNFDILPSKNTKERVFDLSVNEKGTFLNNIQFIIRIRKYNTLYYICYIHTF